MEIRKGILCCLIFSSKQCRSKVVFKGHFPGWILAHKFFCKVNTEMILSVCLNRALGHSKILSVNTVNRWKRGDKNNIYTFLKSGRHKMSHLQKYHSDKSIILTKVSFWPKYHSGQSVILTKGSFLPKCHSNQKVILSKVSFWPKCHSYQNINGQMSSNT